MLFVLAASIAIYAHAGGATLKAECHMDWVLQGGAQVQANPVLSIRSGSPKQTTSAVVAQTLTAGSTITSLAFSYQYLTGFGSSGKGSDFTVKIAGKAVYASGELSNYTYTANHSGYSPPVVIRLTNLMIAVPSGATSRIEINFNNNDRNVQLALPLQFNISCSGETCAAAAVWEPSERYVVFKGGEKDENGKVCPCFRIPSLARVGKPEHLLAFAEGRYGGCRPDVNARTRIVMRKSLDGMVGKKWGPIRVIAGNDPAFPPVDGINYPSPIVDVVTGIVHLFYTRNKQGLWRISSSDGGTTWSKRVNMTEQAGFAIGVAGGGGGVQLKSGRLLFPCHGEHSITACFTDDHGVTWKRGADISPGQNVNGLGESALIADGRGASTVSMTNRVGST
jgi:hypothetical protein